MSAYSKRNRYAYKRHALNAIVLFLALIAVLAIVAGYLPHAAGT